MDLKWGRTKRFRVVPKPNLFLGLPNDIIGKILRRLPLKEAAKTNVLSKMWRNLYLTRPCLVFDKQFFQENFENKQNPGYVYMRLIYKLLLSNVDDILEFVLYIPNLPCDWGMHIDQWLEILSTKNISELNVESEWDSPYKLHSYVYTSKSLTKLKLKNCIFKPSVEKCSFLPNLVQLSFKKVAFASDLFGTIVPNLPLLKNLIFTRCTGIEYFNISAPKLSTICAYDAHVVKSNFLDKFPNVTSVTIGLGPNKVYEHGSIIDLSKMHITFSRLEGLGLDGPFLKLSAATGIPRGFIPFYYLTSLLLHDICFEDSDQISCALCLIRSSPNLVTINITKIRRVGSSLESIINLLEEPNCMGEERLKLQKVEISSINGLKSELLFIERILSRSPFLKYMHVKFEGKDARDELNIAFDLMQFCRASPEAKVICSGKFS